MTGQSSTHDHGHDHDHEHAPDGVWAHISGLLRSLVAGHQHDGSESVDHALEASERGIRALKISLLGLGATAGFQLVVVLASGSVALLADTVHNFSDALTAVPLWIAFWVGRRVANRRYTYGYGRAEDLAGVFIVAMIALSSVVAAWESLQRLLAPQPLQNIGWVVVAAVIGFVGNEGVAWYRIKVGKDIGSVALVADGYHARADGLTSLAVLIGALGVLAGYPLADPLVGLAITIAILFVLRDAALRVFYRLMDAVEPGLTEAAQHVLETTPGVEEAPEVRIRWVGHQLWADANVTVNSERSFTEAHAIADDARHRLLHDVARLTQVTVHVDPCVHSGADHHIASAHHSASASPSATASLPSRTAAPPTH